MARETDRQFGAVIVRLIRGEDLSKDEARSAFHVVLDDATSEMQQGAFLAALAAKGETAAEAAGAWEAISAADTEKVTVTAPGPLVENSGTGMDTFKTFNVSTAASLLAAAAGVAMARHGARAITSVCGTVDMAEALGVDVECGVDLVAKSIAESGIGLFNGMSPRVHPRALGRILSKISFGSTLNIAASLANPALPKRAVRGVYSREMVRPVAEVMRAIGYERAIVVYGGIDGSELGMDEASVCGTTHAAELLESGDIRDFSFRPGEFSLKSRAPAGLTPNPDRAAEARSFVALVRGAAQGARTDAVLLNTALIHVVAGRAGSIGEGVSIAAESLASGGAYRTLECWVAAQNREPERGLETLRALS